MSFLADTIQGTVSDGTIISANMSPAYERGYISVLFYSDEFETVVIPSAGTITFEGSETGDKYGTFTNGTVDATLELYDRTNFSGSVQNVRATTSGITGALNYRALINRFENGR